MSSVYRGTSHALLQQSLVSPITIEVTEEYHVAHARHMAQALAKSIDLRRACVYEVAISVSELGNNLFFHTSHGGRITLSIIEQDDYKGIEIISEDGGPGIPSIEQAMQDGFTTNRGLGGGLPGVKRLMHEFEIDSTVGQGTRIVARKWSKWK